LYPNQILKKKKENPQADTGELEREIDEMVYGLYGLTEGEIKIIKSS
jgi:adenine-specific DNA-methyltransferase